MCYIVMRVISKAMLQHHWEMHGREDSEQQLRAWHQEAENARWGSPQDIRDGYPSASFVGERVVFNIKGNKYRLVVYVNYDYFTVYTRFVGTHSEYDEIDVRTI